MARKRLSDLLREEGQKAADQNAPEIAKPNQSSPAKSPKSTNDAIDDSADVEAIPVTAEVIASQAEQVEDFVAELRDASAEPDHEAGFEADHSEPAYSEADGKTSAPDLTALEATLTQLKAELEAAQQATQSAQAQQMALQEKISKLEAKVSAQAEVIQQLQTEKQQVEQQSQQQVEQLKAELESARTMILQLSEANAKPTAKPLPSSRAAEPELESTNTQIVVPSAKSARPNPPATVERPKLHQLELRKMLDHPTRPGSLPPMPSETKPVEKEKEVKLSDTDVGWMD